MNPKYLYIKDIRTAYNSLTRMPSLKSHPKFNYFHKVFFNLSRAIQ